MKNAIAAFLVTNTLILAYINSAQSQIAITTTLESVEPGDIRVVWTAVPDYAETAYQLETASDPAGPWQAVIGPVVREDVGLEKTHRTDGPSGFFRVKMLGYGPSLPSRLLPDQAVAIHEGHLSNRDLAFDEAFITFNAPTDITEISAANGIRWKRLRAFSETEGWWQAFDGLSSGDRGEDLVVELAELNGMSGVKIAYPVLMYGNLRQWIKPRIMVQAKPGQSYSDLQVSLGSAIFYDGTFQIQGSPDFVYFGITDPKEDNLFSIIDQFRNHPAVAAVDYDGYVTVSTE